MNHFLTARAYVVRFVLVTAVLLSAATPLSLASARSTNIDSALGRYDQPGGLLGTAWFKGLFQTPSCATSGDLVIANGETCGLPSGTYTFTSITVQTGGTLILAGNAGTGQGVTLNAGSLTVESGALIHANGQGYPSAAGPGKGANGNWYFGQGGAPDTAGLVEMEQMSILAAQVMGRSMPQMPWGAAVVKTATTLEAQGAARFAWWLPTS